MEGFSFRLETEILGNQSQNDKFIPQDFFFTNFGFFKFSNPYPPILKGGKLSLIILIR